MGEDVDGLVVPVGEAGDAAHEVELWAVVRVDILVKPEMVRHLRYPQQWSGAPTTTIYFP